MARFLLLVSTCLLGAAGFGVAPAVQPTCSARASPIVLGAKGKSSKSDKGGGLFGSFNVRAPLKCIKNAGEDTPPAVG